MKRSDIKAGYETYGKKWGNTIWLVRDLDKRRTDPKRYYCVMGYTRSGWWHLFYGTLAECRNYFEYENGERNENEVRK